MLESMWMKSNWGERESASAIALCGASKIEMSWTPPTPMPVCFLNSAIAACIGTKYGDQIIPLTAAARAALAAATVRSSMDAARAKGVVPGMRFATVIPTPPSTNVRREILDLVMASSLQSLLCGVIENARSHVIADEDIRSGNRAACQWTLVYRSLPSILPRNVLGRAHGRPFAALLPYYR